MKIEVFDQGKNFSIGEFETDAIPRVGEVLVFAFSHSRRDRYCVVEVEHQLEVSMRGEAVLDLHTTRMKTVLLAQEA